MRTSLLHSRSWKKMPRPHYRGGWYRLRRLVCGLSGHEWERCPEHHSPMHGWRICGYCKEVRFSVWWLAADVEGVCRVVVRDGQLRVEPC